MRFFEIGQRLIPAAPPASDISGDTRDFGVIGQLSPRDGEFVGRTLVIGRVVIIATEFAMHFTEVRPYPNRGINRLFGQWEVTLFVELKTTAPSGEFTIRQRKTGIALNRLLEKFDFSEQTLFPIRWIVVDENRSCLIVKVVSLEVAGRSFTNRSFLLRRDFRPQLIGNLLRDLGRKP